MKFLTAILLVCIATAAETNDEPDFCDQFDDYAEDCREGLWICAEWNGLDEGECQDAAFDLVQFEEDCEADDPGCNVEALFSLNEYFRPANEQFEQAFADEFPGDETGEGRNLKGKKGKRRNLNGHYFCQIIFGQRCSK